MRQDEARTRLGCNSIADNKMPIFFGIFMQVQSDNIRMDAG
jgi:hypothetical protein